MPRKIPLEEQDAVSLREFGRICGKTHTWVRRRIADGTIPANSEGKVPLNAGLAAFEKLASQMEAAANPLTDPAVKTVVDLKDARAVAHAYSVARLQEKQATAKVKAAETELKRLELKVKNGTYVEVADVIADATKTATIVREKLLTIPVRYSGLLEGRTQREIEGALETAVDEVLKAIHESKFVKT